MNPTMTAPGTKRLKLACDEPLSNFAFKFSLRRYSMEHTMKRALSAIFVTSFTTAAAFLATAITPILPLRSFGVFSVGFHKV
jgi:hypothetical protein